MLFRFRDSLSTLLIRQTRLQCEILENFNWSCWRGVATSPLQQRPSRIAGPVASNNLCRAVYRQLPISSKKLTPVARLVRKMRVTDALLQCDLIQRKGALIVQNAIRSARANGIENQGLDGANLVVQECYATNGRDLKRIRIHGRGRSGIMRRRRTHLTVILREDAQMKICPHVVQPSWMQRELQRETTTERRLSKQRAQDGVKKPRLKWKKMLRIQKLQKQAQRKASRATKRSSGTSRSSDSTPSHELNES